MELFGYSCHYIEMDWTATSTDYQSESSESLAEIVEKAFIMLGEKKRKVAVTLYWKDELAASITWNRRGAVLISWNDEPPEDWNEKTWKTLEKLFLQALKARGEDIAYGFKALLR